MKTTWYRRFARRPGAVAGALVLVALALGALGAPHLLRSPWAMVGDPLLVPFSQRAFPLGTDMLGRDVLNGLVWGTRVSLAVGLAATCVTLTIGMVVGALAGWSGGWIDDGIMRVVELFQTVPQVALAVVIAALMGASLTSTVAAISIASWPAVARIVRAEFMSLSHREFVLAARMIGRRPAAIMFSEILPHAIPSITVVATLMVATSILTESALSFLGLGDPAAMSWGFMIGAARNVIRDAWWLSVWPGAAIVVTVLSVHLVGDGLRHSFDGLRSVAGRVQ